MAEVVIDRAQATRFIALIQLEQQRSEAGQINYLMPGAVDVLSSAQASPP